ncbi:hypothetical protein K040078D81_38990 [Blautia hominis]|uniref:PucR C-terminal helix-turn-helix domain-containing protein n=1 Tax=Blautia hominis TaxID=2025493 RepID=A0ABQ0BE98_9FIRM
MTENHNSPAGLLLSMQILYEKLKELEIPVSLLPTDEEPCLSGIQFYTGQQDLSHTFLYLADCKTLASHPFLLHHGFLAVVGQPAKENIHDSCCCLIFPETMPVTEIFNALQQIFVSYSHLERKLNDILNRDGSLYDITVAALEHFHNPVFIHDEYFHILACPRHFEGALNFTYNEQTKRYMQDLNTINFFRTSPAYKKTLSTSGGQFWDSDFNNDRCIYVNLWMNGNYRGRFIISEMETPVTQGQLYVASYFAEIIKLALLRRNDAGEDERHPLEKLIIDTISGTETDRLDMSRKLELLGWKEADQYLCGIISFESTDVTKLSVYSICNEIEERIEACQACYYKGHIYLLVNTGKSQITPQDLRMKMSYIIREGLLRMGVSFPFRGFSTLSIHLKQAQIALSYSQMEQVPHWYNEFQDYVLKYWLLEGTGDFTKESIAPDTLHQLRHYDREHGTELYETLKTYLMNERNSTLTAQLLKINRSTLPHRLNRITQLTGANLDDFMTRLYLMMGCYILDYI